MTFDAESLYLQLGRLVESMPDLTRPGPLSAETHRWLGRAFALVFQVADPADIGVLTVAINNLDSSIRDLNAHTIISVVHRALALAELEAPATAQGAFIPAGNAFDAFAAVGKVLSGATREVLIVDPYMDEKALTDFAPLASENVTIRLLADENYHKPTLKPAAVRWTSQYGNARPLEARLASARALHDRLIVVDGQDAWTLTQSLNAFAARSPASIVRVDAETAALKVAAYQDRWKAAKPL